MAVITDANVLIDYAGSDVSILALYSENVSEIYIPATVLDEVDGFSETDCERLKLVVIEEDLEILERAATESGGPLSYEDRVCLLLAQEKGMVCVSNDKPLHKACQQAGIESKWGLRLMIELVQMGHMELRDAIAVAEAIRLNNPMFITEQVIEQFQQELR